MCQHAFVGKRQICDCVLVANEVVDLRFKSDYPVIMCKLDMEKIMTMFIWSSCIYWRGRVSVEVEIID